MTAHDPKLVETVAIAMKKAIESPLCKLPDEITHTDERIARAALDAINLDERIRAAVEAQRQKDAALARRHAEKCNEAAEKIPRDYAGHLAEKHKAREATAIADAIEVQ